MNLENVLILKVKKLFVNQIKGIYVDHKFIANSDNYQCFVYVFKGLPSLCKS